MTTFSLQKLKISLVSSLAELQEYNFNMQQNKIKILTLKDQETGAEDKYALGLKPLGQGKSAKVYKATNWPDQTKLLAVKVIKITSAEVRKDYLKELKIIKNLPDCPNIVKTYKQHLQSQNNLYIFQEYCDSGTLATYKAEKLGVPFTQEEIYDVFYQTTNGLIFLLQAGIVHEDLKPANILKRGPYFKLCDFGVSQISEEYISTTTRKGTISYMPPQKLKTKNFIPSDVSDIYSLGVCLYQIIFGIHPYLNKKTANYKEYLLALNGVTLKPLPTLMKKIRSTSLKLEDLFKFMERMIDLNPKTRITLAQLKQFLNSSEPFKNMRALSEQIQSFTNFQNKVAINQTEAQFMFQSVITYKNDKNTNSLPILKPRANPNVELKQKILDNYARQTPYVIGVISILIKSIDLIRKSNFHSLNIKPVQKNFLGIDLTTCKVSRFLKYLIYQYSIVILKRFRKRYEGYLQQQQEEKFYQNEEYMQSQFNKFLIECDFENKEELAEALKSRDNNMNLWLEIVRYFEDFAQNLTIIEENKRSILLCYLYCVYIPKILDLFKNVGSIFSQQTLQALEKQPNLSDTSLEDGESLLDQINQAEKMKKQKLLSMVQHQLNMMQRQYIFDIGQDSEEIEVITEEELAMI